MLFIWAILKVSKMTTLSIIKRLDLNLKARFKSLFSCPQLKTTFCKKWGFELEKIIDTPGFLANFLNTHEKEHFCSIHKAVIPIARLRVLLDQDDVGDTVSFRCLECSKCITCKKSQRSNAVRFVKKATLSLLSIHF